MLRSIFVLLSCGVGYFVYAHAHCHYYQREVDFGRDLTFCSMDYASEGICCTEEEETALEETFNASALLLQSVPTTTNRCYSRSPTGRDLYHGCYVMQHLGPDVENRICHLVPPTMIPGSLDI